MSLSEEKEEMLRRLVENGFDFLNRAVDELEKHPKFSIIHFHTAVELFLKARLMEEHWSLVISQQKDLDWNKFISGDFRSVSLNEAAGRLEKVVRSGLSKSELKSFQEITTHRNKVVHFFHEDHSGAENNKQVIDIVKQQLTAWYFLHHILTTRWKDVFDKWRDHLLAIDVNLRSLNTFLQVIFAQKKPDIENRESEGEIFQRCPSCGFDSQPYIADQNVIYEATCLVCGLFEKVLKIDCQFCNKKATFINGGFGNCNSCNINYGPSDLVAELINNGAAYNVSNKFGEPCNFGNCSDCNGYQTVVRTKDDSYLCAKCFLTFDSLQHCASCYVLNTGNMEHSIWDGCNHCLDKMDWLKDDYSLSQT